MGPKAYYHRVMVKPISLRIRHAAILRDARAALALGGREEELRRAHSASVRRKAHAIVAQAQEQKRLKRVAALAAHKAVLAVHQAYFQMDKVGVIEFERAAWNAR